MIGYNIRQCIGSLLALAVCTAAMLGSPRTQAAELPNILLIVSEDNGPELGCYGDPYAQTPVLDRLAEEGVRFENAFVPYPVCSPSRACFLTGLYPHQNGQIGLATHKFAMFPGVETLPAVLKQHGYRTGMIGKLHVNPASAFPFDFRKITGANFGKRNVRDYADAAAEFFTDDSEQPFFLSINYPDAHFPLHRQQFGLPKEPISGDDVEPLPWVGVDSPRLREFTANYYNCLRRLDDGVGMLLDELQASGHADNTFVVYIGDHGAQFSRGKCSVYEAGLRVPLIVRWPNHQQAGLVRRELTSTLDLVPTFLAAAGVDVPTYLPGRPLQPLLESDVEPPSWRQYIVGFTTGAAPGIFCLQQSIRDKRYKLISNPLAGSDVRTNLSARAYLTQYNQHFAAGCTADEIATAAPLAQQAYARFLSPPRYELYDLQADPHEFTNLAQSTEHAEIKARLIAALQTWQRETNDPFADEEKLASFTQSQLEAIGTDYRSRKSFRWSYLDWQAPTRFTAVNDGDAPSAGFRTGFESIDAGPLTEVTFDGVTWRAMADHAEILDKLARNGRQCLHLKGGEHERTIELRRPPVASHRVGVALRQHGQDGVHTYRIPGITTTKAGTLIAVYDNRNRGGGDLPGDIDVGMSRSTDGGQSWEPMKVIMDMGDDPNWHYDGIGDPSILTDQRTGTIWVAATWSHGNRSWRGSGPGMTPEETGQLMLTKSDDDGRSWSQPINITAQVKADPNWRFVLQGPGNGITLRDGTLVFPAQYRGQDDEPIRGRPFSTIIFSQDRGATWKIGSGVKIDTTEAQIVQLGDDSIMINCRDNRGGSRSVYTTRDLGQTWSEHPTSRKALPEPVCNADLMRIVHPTRGPLLFFSNPNTTRGRHHFTIKVSDDEGQTWPDKWHTLYDERPGSGYSTLTHIDQDRIGILYEGPGELYFLRYSIDELMQD